MEAELECACERLAAHRPHRSRSSGRPVRCKRNRGPPRSPRETECARHRIAAGQADVMPPRHVVTKADACIHLAYPRRLRRSLTEAERKRLLVRVKSVSRHTPRDPDVRRRLDDRERPEVSGHAGLRAALEAVRFEAGPEIGWTHRRPDVPRARDAARAHQILRLGYRDVCAIGLEIGSHDAVVVGDRRPADYPRDLRVVALATSSCSRYASRNSASLSSTARATQAADTSVMSRMLRAATGTSVEMIRRYVELG